MKKDDNKTGDNRLTRLKLDGLEVWILAYLRDCQTRNLAPASVQFYRDELARFSAYCQSRQVFDVLAITADLLRDFLGWLQTDHHRNPGGRHAAFRSVRAFLLWWERETDPDDWDNPIKRVKIGKAKLPPIPGVPAVDVAAMMDTCGADFIGLRDKALLLCLLDSGARAQEFIGLNLADVDLVTGAVIVRKGKGSKARTVFIGKKSRKALRAYIRKRADDDPALWVKGAGGRLAVSSLRQVILRRAKRAGLKDIPSPHDFRRSFAVNMLRAGVDIFRLQKLLGHESLEVLTRYLALVTDDIQRAHEQGSPVDKLL